MALNLIDILPCFDKLSFVMAMKQGQDTAVRAARFGISLDWLAVGAALLAVLLVKLGWLPGVSW